MIEIIKGKIKIDNKYLSSFKRLPFDKYLKYHQKNYRLRRFSKFNIKNEKIFFEKETFFLQKETNNRFLGGVNRKYSPLEKPCLKYFSELVRKNFNFIVSKKNFEIGLHQIRITCGKDFVGYPVPEGWHRDGFDYVAIINFASKNIEGGISRIRSSITQNSDNYSGFLAAGEYLFFNDRKFYHYADPINVSKNKKNGFRDTLVITFKILK